MTARPQDVALLPLPPWGMLSANHPSEWYTARQMADYARANVTAALASAQAREDELRAEVERLKAEADSGLESFDAMYALVRQYRHRTERLEEALRPMVDYAESGKVAEPYMLAAARAALSTNAATQTGETNEAAE